MHTIMAFILRHKKKIIAIAIGLLLIGAVQNCLEPTLGANKLLRRANRELRKGYAETAISTCYEAQYYTPYNPKIEKQLKKIYVYQIEELIDSGRDNMESEIYSLIEKIIETDPTAVDGYHMRLHYYADREDWWQVEEAARNLQKYTKAELPIIEEGKVLQEPTCQLEGTTKYRCTICDQDMLRHFPVLQYHVWDEGETVKPANCSEEGVFVRHCTGCTATLTVEIEENDEHKWDSGEIEKEPTPTEPGWIVYRCILCGMSRGEEVPADADGSYTVGSVLKFGSYEQGNGEEPIEWKVLKREGDKLLIVSQYCLDVKPYHNSQEEVTWETCDLRQWLDTTFIETAFTQEEQEKLCTADIKVGDKTVSDRVFILSGEEVSAYGVPFAKATALTKNKNIAADPDNGRCSCWLRDVSTEEPDYASLTFAAGGNGIRPIYTEGIGVRPACWIDMGAAQ